MRIARFLSLSLVAVCLISLQAQAEDKNIPLEITADKALEWNQADKSYIARGSAIAQQGDMSVKADMLTAKYKGANNSTSDIHFITADGNVTLVSGKDTATGDKATYDLESGKAILSGARPKIVQDGGNTLEADLITVWTVNNALDHAEATGNVVITGKEQTATSEKATYTASTNIAELIGKVKIKQDVNMLEGDRAELNMTTNVSKMTSQGKSARVKGVFYPSASKKSKAE